MTNKPAQVTEAHRVLASTFFGSVMMGQMSSSEIAQLIADSESQVVNQRPSWALADSYKTERDQLRAEVERLRQLNIVAVNLKLDAVASAERAEAELAKERARLDFMNTRGFEHRHHETGDWLAYEWTITSAAEHKDVNLRDTIDAAMKEESK